MEQAMIGPSPNPLILSYLKYAISSQVRRKVLVVVSVIVNIDRLHQFWC